ncbi:MAG: YlmC/YmxH family sporulation protein, partial [Clostridiaceae bacterium]|nr:YlmC/YmxH family sporulation protein [Clostridiaceae bacterium]
NIKDGRRLGFVTDVELNLESGRIDSIVVPGPARLLGFFGQSEDIVIPWDKIHKIGDDIILVEYDETQYRRRK